MPTPMPPTSSCAPCLTEEEREEGKKDRGEVVWIDCGMMGELSPHERGLFFDMMKAMVFKDGHALTDLFIEWGRVERRPGQEAQLWAIAAGTYHVGEPLRRRRRLLHGYSPLLNDIMAILDTANVIMPRSFVMLVRGLASLQGTLISLTPDISILRVVERYVRSAANKRFDPRQGS